MKVAVIGAGIMGSGIAQIAAAAEHTVNLCDVDAATLEDGFDAGHIALVCALDFLAVAQLVAWQAEHPQLAAWLQRLQARPSIVATKPKPPPIDYLRFKFLVGLTKSGSTRSRSFLFPSGR